MASAQISGGSRETAMAIGQHAGRWLFTVTTTGCPLAGSKTGYGSSWRATGTSSGGVSNACPIESLCRLNGEMQVRIQHSAGAQTIPGEQQVSFIKQFRRGGGHREELHPGLSSILG